MNARSSLPALLLGVLSAAPISAHDPSVRAAALTAATCSGRSAYAVWVVNAASAGDCTTTGGGTTQVHCCCANGAWAECGDGEGASDHGALTGLTDDDHSIYALLAGRSGGQVCYGGTADDDDFEARATDGSVWPRLILDGSLTAPSASISADSLTEFAANSVGAIATFESGGSEAFRVYAANASPLSVTQIAQISEGGQISGVRLCANEASPTATAPCISEDGSGRLYHDTDGDGTKDGGEEYIDQTGGGGSITVEEVDGAPSVASVTEIQFDSADGFVVTDNTGGSVRIDFAAAGHSGHLSGVQVYTSGSGTYTVPAGVTSIVVEAVGAGGGGGGGDGSTTVATGAGGGGGAGAYCREYIGSPSASYAYAVGSGGGGGAAGPNTGSTGGNTTFGSSFIVANGGSGGFGGGPSALNAAAGGAGGSASGCDISTSGGSGQGGTSHDDGTPVMALGGTGGASFFGSGGAGGTDAAGSAAATYGAGGGGGGASSSTDRAGGNGAGGVIFIYEYSDEDAVVTSGFAPYGEYDPDRPPSSVYLSDEFTGGASLTWKWANQDSATIEEQYDGLRLDGVGTNELHVRYIDEATHATPTNSDQTFCAAFEPMEFPTGTADACGIIVLEQGTTDSPTEVSHLMGGDFSTDGFYLQTDADYNPASGASVAGSSTSTLLAPALQASKTVMKLSYVDSTRVLTASASFGGRAWKRIAGTTTLSADPIAWGVFARQSAICHVDWVRLFDSADADCGE